MLYTILSNLIIFLSRPKSTPSQITTTTTTAMPALNNAKMLDELNQAHIAYLMKPPSFTIDDVDDQNLFRDLEIMEPVEFQNKTFHQHLENLPWEDSLLTKTIERRLINGKHMTFCRLHNDTLALVGFVLTAVFVMFCLCLHFVST